MTTSEDTTELTDNRPSSPVAPACCPACLCTETDEKNEYPNTLILFKCGACWFIDLHKWRQDCTRAHAAAVELRARSDKLKRERDWFCEQAEIHSGAREMLIADNAALRARLEQAEAERDAASNRLASMFDEIRVLRGVAEDDSDWSGLFSNASQTAKDCEAAIRKLKTWLKETESDRNTLTARLAELQAVRDVRNTVVCLCGSTRFKSEFEKVNADLTMRGVIVLSVGLFGHADGLQLSARDKEMLDELHKRKIDLADEIFVINVGGYVGESTRSEIAYARATGKAIKCLEPKRKQPDCLKPWCGLENRLCVDCAALASGAESEVTK